MPQTTPPARFIEIGEPAPALTLPDLDGRPLSVEGYRGRKLLLFMWASW